ncbi:hypothetical protein F5144DRAFT_598642 [Chaetomium tenue]|uniref:Uncharacterized protein n=1 Tax=Chaetomium tenue TaxID=1854479 RepID=A0ACB7PQS0_9PEZI|nr:hypothetical protein F5144DRAFT_598642 [Chaetomium globosum]
METADNPHESEDWDDGIETPLQALGSAPVEAAEAHTEDQQSTATQSEGSSLLHHLHRVDHTGDLAAIVAMAFPERDEQDFEYYNFFFYCPLMDPFFFMVVTASMDTEYQDAWIDGYTIKLWQNAYPVVLPSQDNGPQGRVHGKLWQAVNPELITRIRNRLWLPLRPAHC